MRRFLARQKEWTRGTWWPTSAEEQFQIIQRWQIKGGSISEFPSFVDDQERYDEFHAAAYAP